MITHKQYPNHHIFETEIGGRTFTVETGKVAELCNAEAICRYGDTVVLVTAVASPLPKAGIDYFPLTIEVEERMYAVGRIPGSFNRREGKPSDRGVLISRLIDRPMRPLFDEELRNDVVLTNTILAQDYDNPVEIVASIGSSLVIAYSDIPWNGPVAALKVGLVDGKLVFNPDSEQRKVSDLDVTVVSTGKKVVMIEAGANEVPNDVMFEAIRMAHQENQKQVALINQMVSEIGKPKFDYPHADFDEELFQKIVNATMDEAKAAMDTDDKNVREARWNQLIEKWHELFLEDYPEMDKYLEEITYKFQKKIVKAWLLEGHRVDGRQKNEIRPLAAEVGVLPRVHGSGLFTRGQTQVLSVATLDTLSACQKLDTIWEETEKRYMHHYNFPPYCVGETGRMGNPGRREIGHGALGERALAQVLPSVDEFPYTIRTVADVMESNGSSSQASICAGTMSLMAAGVPIKAPVAGIAMGLIMDDNSGKYTVLTDIQGMEDHFGDMDFKVAGTKNGITALQMDIKVTGITKNIFEEALAQAHKARLEILDNMLACIPSPREQLSPYAPKIAMMNIDPDKIKDVIGPGGKMINEIIAQCDNVKIDIDDDGKVVIYHNDYDTIEKAKQMISDIVRVAKVGDVYAAKVVRLEKFGAFVNLFGNTDGLLHISKISHHRVDKVEDVLKLGDIIDVKVTEIDNKGRINVSAKALLPKPKTEEEKTEA